MQILQISAKRDTCKTNNFTLTLHSTVLSTLINKYEKDNRIKLKDMLPTQIAFFNSHRERYNLYLSGVYEYFIYPEYLSWKFRLDYGERFPIIYTGALLDLKFKDTVTLNAKVFFPNKEVQTIVEAFSFAASFMMKTLRQEEIVEESA